MRKFFLWLLILVLLFAVWTTYSFYKASAPSQVPELESNSKVSQNTGWKTYTNVQNGFQFKYPSEMIIKNEFFSDYYALNQEKPAFEVSIEGDDLKLFFATNIGGKGYSGDNFLSKEEVLVGTSIKAMSLYTFDNDLGSIWARTGIVDEKGFRYTFDFNYQRSQDQRQVIRDILSSFEFIK